MEYVTSFINETIVNGDVGRRPQPPSYIEDFKSANKILISVLLALIMLSMGCMISVPEIKKTFRQPAGVIIGAVSQFVIMPLTTFALAHAVDIEAPFAIGMLIIGCCPGGTLSNLFTYWTEGDVCLSVIMTTVSTILAFGMMPLNLFIYSRSWTDEQSGIPFFDIAITLIAILGPVLIGMFIRHKFKVLIPFITKTCSVVSFIGILVSVTLNSMINPGMFASGWKVWFTAIILPLLGFSLGYGLALILRQSHVKCRTIAFETGNQNVGLSLGIIMLTFGKSPMFFDLLTFPSLFGIFMTIDSFVFMFIWSIITKMTKNEEPEHAIEEGVKVALKNDITEV